MVDCDWCKGADCRSKNSDTCDWKTLAKTPQAMMNRMEEEYQKIEASLGNLANTKDKKLLAEILRDTKDRLLGVKQIRDELEAMGHTYKPTTGDPLKFTLLAIQIKKNLKRLGIK